MRFEYNVQIKRNIEKKKINKNEKGKNFIKGDTNEIFYQITDLKKEKELQSKYNKYKNEERYFEYVTNEFIQNKGFFISKGYINEQKKGEILRIGLFNFIFNGYSGSHKYSEDLFEILSNKESIKKLLSKPEYNEYSGILVYQFYFGKKISLGLGNIEEPEYFKFIPERNKINIKQKKNSILNKFESCQTNGIKTIDFLSSLNFNIFINIGEKGGKEEKDLEIFEFIEKMKQTNSDLFKFTGIIHSLCTDLNYQGSNKLENIIKYMDFVSTNSEYNKNQLSKIKQEIIIGNDKLIKSHNYQTISNIFRKIKEFDFEILKKLKFRNISLPYISKNERDEKEILETKILNYSENKKKIIFNCSRIVTYKNIEKVVEMMTDEKFNDYKLIIYGNYRTERKNWKNLKTRWGYNDGMLQKQYIDKINKKIFEKGLGDKVFFINSGKEAELKKYGYSENGKTISNGNPKQDIVISVPKDERLKQIERKKIFLDYLGLEKEFDVFDKYEWYRVSEYLVDLSFLEDKNRPQYTSLEAIDFGCKPILNESFGGKEFQVDKNFIGIKNLNLKNDDIIKNNIDYLKKNFYNGKESQFEKYIQYFNFI